MPATDLTTGFTPKSFSRAVAWGAGRPGRGSGTSHQTVPEPRGALTQCSTRNWGAPYAALAPTPGKTPGLPAQAWCQKCTVDVSML